MNIQKESKLSILISLAPVLSMFQWEKTISEKYDMSILNSVKDYGFDLNLENLNELRKTARRLNETVQFVKSWRKQVAAARSDDRNSGIQYAKSPCLY